MEFIKLKFIQVTYVLFLLIVEVVLSEHPGKDGAVAEAVAQCREPGDDLNVHPVCVLSCVQCYSLCVLACVHMCASVCMCWSVCVQVSVHVCVCKCAC